MERVALAGSDLMVSPICIGTWQFNGGKADETWPAQDETVSKAIVDKAIELGVNFFDTAEAYGLHESERVLSRCLAGCRQDVIIASKFGRHEGGKVKEYAATDIEQALTASLQALQTDYIDIYQIHWSVNMRDVHETVAELNRQKSLGRIRQYGICNFGSSSIEEFFATGGKPCSLQVPYSLLWRAIEYNILPTIRQHGLSVLAYSPLQQGLLTGRFHNASEVPEGRRRTRHFSSDSTNLSRHEQKGAEEETFKAINDIRDLCNKENIPMSSAALSWILSQEGAASVVVGCRTPQQLEDNCKLIKLSQSVVKRLSDCTAELKEKLGDNPDMWAKTSRYK
ncbi:aldo-keto reductase IolS-like [Patiria miniata]|uniref:NADP-dependent oxidoreductase domain-containing protein n=1 Tax=Patiria miniata TaxID=46514 RepID=A0A913YZS0_PATMI|nr:aldo-keto reductase IolS-like [Patiria miniata]XP_038045200.1 aldo-keto reductase IolS-like [Patiria miniata]